MVSVNISYDGGVTATGNLSSIPLAEIDPFYDSPSGGSVLLVTLSFFALFLSVPALVWHIKNRSLPASSLILWIVLENVFNIINALIWPNDNVTTWWIGEGYCDINIKLDAAANIGLLGSLCCILKSLAKALDTDNARLMLTPAKRQRTMLLEIFYCIGFPIVFAVLGFIIQPYRYYVFAIAGCVPPFSDSWLTVMIYYVWPPIFCVINAYYSILLIIRIRYYRRDFSIILTSSTSGLNKSRFIRLFTAAMILLFIVIPTQIYALYRNLQDPITTFDWFTTHDPKAWNTVVFVPTYGTVFPDRWIRTSLALPVFICFGWGRDAKILYKSWALLLGLDRFFPSLGPNGNSTTQPGTSRKNLLATNSTSSSSTLLSKTLTLFTRPFSLVSNLASGNHGKPTLSSLANSSTSSTSNAKNSPTHSPAFSPGSKHDNATVKAHDFITAAPEPGISIPLTTLAVKNPSVKNEEVSRPHSLSSLSPPSISSESTYINSPSSSARGTKKSYPPHSYLPYAQKVNNILERQSELYNRSPSPVELENRGLTTGGSIGAATGTANKKGNLEGMTGKETKRLHHESKKEGKGKKEIKKSWETAAEAMERVEAEKEYERMVVGALV
ncbi:a-factor receptor [Thelotrema lepadinum]|nr:a-factor receptor [Thelotrema lepadinum]